MSSKKQKKPTQKQQYKQLSATAKRNVKLTGIIVVIFFGVIIYAFTGGDEPEQQESAASTDLSEASNTGVERSTTDATQALDDVSSADYRSQLEAAEQSRAESAKKSGDTDYVRDVSTLGWASDNDQRDPDEINLDFDIEPDVEPLPDNYSSPNNNRDIPASDVNQTSPENTEPQVSLSGPGMDVYEREAQQQQESRRQQEGERRMGSNVRQLTGPEQQAYLDAKRNAAMQLMNAFNRAPEGAVIDNTPDTQSPSNAGNGSTTQLSSQPTASPQPTGTASMTRGRAITETVAGVVPGDRFVGATKMAINTDNSTWVDVVIGSGPLKGAIIGMEPKRVHDRVVLQSQTITHKRRTAPFESIAINPGQNMEPAFATEVNMRYLARIGSAVATEVLGTVAELIGKESSSSVTEGGFAQQEIDFSKEELAIAGGAAGLSEGARQLNQEVNKLQPQVKVKSGHRVVLVVTKAQEIPWMPAPFVIHKTTQSQ